MKSQFCIAALLLLPVCASFALHQEKKAVAAAATDDPMMAKMKEFATPGLAHKALDVRAPVAGPRANTDC